LSFAPRPLTPEPLSRKGRGEQERRVRVRLSSRLALRWCAAVRFWSAAADNTLRLIDATPLLPVGRQKVADVIHQAQRGELLFDVVG